MTIIVDVELKNGWTIMKRAVAAVDPDSQESCQSFVQELFDTLTGTPKEEHDDGREKDLHIIIRAPREWK